MSADQNKAVVNRFFDEVCNARKLAAADEIFTADHTYHDPSAPTGPGPDGMRQVIALYHTSFPDARWTVEDQLADGDMVVTRWTGRGTHGAELMGLPSTGKQVMVPGIWIHRLAGGKIAESWNVWDTLGMLQQLGAIPAPS